MPYYSEEDRHAIDSPSLMLESVDLQYLAEVFGTPTYVYSRKAIEQAYQAYETALRDYPHGHLICYAVKANSNIAVLNVLAKLGAGFDIVSAGELERVLAAGGEANKVVFSGVGKTYNEIQRALEAGIRCFNVESESELHRINGVAQNMKCQAPISLRVNPDVDAKTHPYISTGLKENKFGIPAEDALRVYQIAKDLPHLNIVGMDCHIGSQLTDVTPFVDALKRVLALMTELEAAGITLSHLDLGGGLGITYSDETVPEVSVLMDALMETLSSTLGERPIELMFEPGRSIVGNAGVLLTRVEHLKMGEEKHFAIIDAAMNDLLRPALYSAWQNIIPLQKHTHIPSHVYDVVGPVCETGDFLGKDRELAIEEGDYLAVLSAGAYGFTMSSNYNSRPRAAEIMVDGDEHHIIRERETFEQLIQGERLLPENS